MLAHVLSKMLATLPRVETLSYMQADHHGVGFEAHIPLTFPSEFTLIGRIWVLMSRCVRILLYDNG